MHIMNAGGFPKGVSAENVLTTNSVPRNKLLMRVMQKTGLVEKSGQGVDKMFYNSIMESKALPDYTLTDMYQVHARLYGEVLNPSFVAFVRTEQDKRTKEEKLNVFELLALYDVAMHRPMDAVCAPYLSGLQSAGLLVDAEGKWQLGAGYEAFDQMEQESISPEELLNFIKDFIKENGVELTERQQDILMMVREDCTITSQKISQKYNVTPRTIIDDMKVLREYGLLRRMKGRKKGYWKLLLKK